MVLGVAGDWIGLTTSGPPDLSSPSGILVAKMSTNQLWFMPAREGFFVNFLALSEDELVVTETIRTDHPAKFQNILRFDLSELDTLVAQGYAIPE